MPRSLSITRRRAGLIDASMPLRPGVSSYNVQWATNFDAAYATFQNMPAVGMTSPGVRSLIDNSFADSQYRGKTRFIFNPNEYGIPDLNPIWLRIQAVNNDGSLGAFEAGQLILPYSSQPNRVITISGTAPAGNVQSDCLEIQLPMQFQNPTHQNNAAATDLFISYEPGGSEYRVRPIATVFELLNYTYGANSQIFVRGGGATASFAIIGSLKNNPSG